MPFLLPLCLIYKKDMEEVKDTLRFGIIADDTKMELWKINTIKTLVANGLKLSLIIKIQGQNESFGNKAAGWLKRLNQKMFFNTKSNKQAALKDHVNISGIPIKSCMAKVIGDAMFFSENDVQFIENQDIDFLIRFNALRVSGELTESLPYGIWEFCFHDEKTHNESRPEGFWEFVGNGETNTVSLQRVSNQRDKAIILKKNHYPIIKSSYDEHVERFLTDCSNIPLQVCRSILHNGKATWTHETRVGKETKNNVGFGGLMRYAWVSTWRKIAGTGTSDDGFDRDIGIAEVPVFDFFQNPDKHRRKIKWLRRTSTSMRYSTPSVITNANDTYIFFAVDDRKENKSCIKMSRKSEEYKKQHTVLENGHSISYPFVFRKDDSLFCIPQDTESQQITLYRFNEDTLMMEKETVLYDGIKAYRPTAVFGNGCWNIFYGRDDSFDTKLNLMTSDDLRGNYTQFYNNPIKTDCRSSLMAGGFISINGKMYRPSYNQKQHSVTLNEVCEMSVDNYMEHDTGLSVGKLRWSRFGKGVQCISGNDLVTVIDGMR